MPQLHRETDLEKTLRLFANTINGVITERQKTFENRGWETYAVVGAVLYGSRVRGTHHSKSDLDMSVLTRDSTPTDVDDFHVWVGRALRRLFSVPSVDLFLLIPTSPLGQMYSGMMLSLNVDILITLLLRMLMYEKRYVPELLLFLTLLEKQLLLSQHLSQKRGFSLFQILLRIL